MTERGNVSGVDIAPGVGVYAMFSSFNYKAWFALAEFVDNSISSYQQHQYELEKLHGPSFVLSVQIFYNETAGTLTIEDNAAGISEARFHRRTLIRSPR